MTPWIKMRTNLLDDPRVRIISSMIGCNAVTVTGGLYMLWSLADQYSTDGKLVGYDSAELDRRFGRDGFAKALASPDVQWLVIGRNFLIVPRFDEHNGQSAKVRSQTVRRVQNHRLRNGQSVTKSLPEIEEEEDKNKDPLTPASGGRVEREKKSEAFRAQNGAYDSPLNTSLKSDELVAPERLPGKPALKSGAPQTDAEKCRSSPKRDDCLSQGFAAFWSEWPKHERKKGKTKCWRKWCRDNLEPVAEQVISCLRRCKVSRQWAKDGGDFVPLPMSWLNDTPWETDPAEMVGGEPEESNADPVTGFVRRKVSEAELQAMLAPTSNGREP